MSPLITAADLDALRATLRETGELVLLDVRWTLGRTDGAERFAAGHIPGARYVDLDTELATAPDVASGRHPLPTPEAFQATARAWGVEAGSTVVVYDEAHSFGAARAWWLLRHAGFDAVRVLDGGYRAWVAAGLPIETGAAAPTAPGTVELGWGALPTIDTDGAAQFPAAGVLLDARAPERFRGEVEPLDPRAGHVPGAVSAPTTGNLVETGEFLDPAALRERFAALGVGSDIPVAVYCGSGITASHQILALEVAGQAAALYPGSWSQWSNDDTREAAVGAG